MSVGSKQEQWHICVSPTREQRTISPIAKPARVELPRLEAKKQTNEKNKQTIKQTTSNQSDCQKIFSNYLHGLNTSGSGCSSWEIQMFILRNTLLDIWTQIESDVMLHKSQHNLKLFAREQSHKRVPRYWVPCIRAKIVPSIVPSIGTWYLLI